MANQNYGQAVSDYTTRLRGLFEPAVEAQARRGAGELAPGELAARTRGLVAASRRLSALTAGYLDSANWAQREGAELKLLAQATAEWQVAQSLLEVAAQGEAVAPHRVTRSAVRAQRATNALISVLETPLEEGIQLPRAKRGAARPTDPALAKADLQAEVDSSTRYIAKQASKIGGAAVRDLLLMDAATLVQGVSLLSKDAGQMLDQLVCGLSGAALQLAQAAAQLLLQAYDALLALLGKETADAARKQIQQWLDELKKDSATRGEEVGLFEKLVNRVYAPDAIRGEVAGWLASREAEVAKINGAAETVKGLADKYRVKTEQVDKLLKVIAFARKLPVLALPQGQVIVAGVMVVALGYTLYTGYDHIDSARVTFNKRFGFDIPDRVEGVRETVQKAMGVPAAPAEQTPLPDA